MTDKLHKMRMGRRALLKGTAASGALLLLPASVRAQEGQPRPGGALRVTMPFNPAALDPMTGRNLPDFNVLYAVFDGLIDFEPKTLELRPGLAREWRFSDPQTLVLDLVDGVEFHDGTPFNAEAVKFNLDRYINDPRSNIKSDLTTISAVEVSGPRQVTIALNTPNAGLPAILTNRAGLMVSPKSVQDAAEGNVDRNPVGTGPFKFVEWRDNDLIKVEKNQNYWQPGLPYLDSIDFRIINELNTGARTVTSGQSDLALNMQAQQKAVADRVPSLVATATPTLTFYGAFLNYGPGPLEDVRVRQAMNYALDREAINQVIALGLGEPTSAILPREFWACDPETAGYYDHDPDRARSLLREAGHPDGLVIRGFGWPDQASVQRQEVMTAQLAEVGIRVSLTPAPPPQAMQQFMVEKQGSLLFSPQGALPDPSQAYERLYAADALRNAGGIELPGFRPLMDATMSAQDQETRTQAFHALQRFTIENAMQLPQFISPGITIATEKVRDFEFGLLSSPKFTSVWLAA